MTDPGDAVVPLVTHVAEVLIVQMVCHIVHRVLVHLAEHCHKAGEVGTLFLIYGLVTVPAHEVIQDSAEEAAVTLSLVLSAAGQSPCDVIENLNKEIQHSTRLRDDLQKLKITLIVNSIT